MRHRSAFIVMAVLSTFGAADAGVISSETFSTSGSIVDYSGTAKVFSASVVSGDGATSVANGKLNMQMVTNTAGTDLAYTHIDLGTAKSLLSVQFDVEGVQYSSASGAFQVFIGGFNTISDFRPDWNPSNIGRFWAKTVISAGSPYTIAAHGPVGSVASTTAALNQSHTWTFFLNDSGSAQMYIGPDQLSHTLQNDEWSFFVDTTAVGLNIAKGASDNTLSSKDLQGIVLMTGRNYEGGKSSTNIDNIIVRDDLAIVPEPAALGLLSLSAFPLLRRRH